MQVEVLINLQEVSSTKTNRRRCSVGRKAENFTSRGGGGEGGDIPIYRDIFCLSTTYVAILVLLMVKFVRACIIV
jgi:hypothetical protein